MSGPALLSRVNGFLRTSFQIVSGAAAAVVGEKPQDAALSAGIFYDQLTMRPKKFDITGGAS